MADLPENNNLLIRPQILTPQQKEQLEEEFAFILTDGERSEDLYMVLDEYFSDIEHNLDAAGLYYETYWKWFVKLVWNRFLQLDVGRVLQYMSTQLPAAYIFGCEIEDTVLYFLYRRFSKDKDMESYFLKIKETLLMSEFPINPTKNTSMSMKTVLESYMRLQRQDDSVKLAEFMSLVELQLFPGNFVLKEGQTKQGIVKQFLSLLLFFVEDKDIVSIVNEYVFTLRLEDPALIRIVEPEDDSIEERIEEPTPPTLPQIKQQTEAKFPDTTRDNSTDILTYLDQLATEYNDDTIRDLYIFDEKTGSFMWNEELLK